MKNTEKNKNNKITQIIDLKETVIMNFSGIYKNQSFYKDHAEKEIFWTELSDLSGCNCYCDAEAADRICEEIQNYTGNGIHFIDSGNYHYMTRLWLEKQQVPFRLLVFDNHTDMQPPAFGGLLSCGGWIAASLEELPLLHEVILVGPDEEAYVQVEPELQQKVCFLSREKLSMMTAEEKEDFFKNLDADLPLYISVDKDVLCKEDASTTWSQGDMHLSELMSFLEVVLELQNVVGMDVCGECDQDSGSEDFLNDHANEAILRLWEKMRKSSERMGSE
ncbi:arginase family protein [Blautia sp. 2744]|uniref:Arginase/agmatinase/formimionoglutamate hydrolase, arginase family n=4 Tax=Lachnospiraceae TaxID=186803 RepID=D4LRZ0_9FIRM|nr:arginase family protein [Blautia intestinalis]RHD32427.1 arginase [Blautia obeum]CBL23548.1 Arginase/agmatinase/formimionoglutamate hydrolase, arginase family [Blautia obeum A2-162]